MGGKEFTLLPLPPLPLQSEYAPTQHNYNLIKQQIGNVSRQGTSEICTRAADVLRSSPPLHSHTYVMTNRHMEADAALFPYLLETS